MNDLEEFTIVLRIVADEAERLGIPSAHTSKIHDVIDVVIPLLEAARTRKAPR